MTSPEAEQSSAVGGVGEDVEKSQDSERHNILDVVLVSSPHPLNILVRAALKIQFERKKFAQFSVELPTLEPGCLASSEEMNVIVLNLCLAVRKDIITILTTTMAV